MIETGVLIHLRRCQIFRGHLFESFCLHTKDAISKTNQTILAPLRTSLSQIEHFFSNLGISCCSTLPWPCGEAEQCSRHRRKGAHCLSPSRRLRPSSSSLCAAGVGEPRREPEGPRHGQHGFGSFCRNKRPSSAGANPIAVKLIYCLTPRRVEDRSPLRAFPGWSSVSVVDVCDSA